MSGGSPSQQLGNTPPRIGENVVRGAGNAISSLLSWETVQAISERIGALGGACVVGGVIGGIAGSGAGGIGAGPGAVAGCKIGTEIAGAVISFEAAYNAADAGYRTVKSGYQLLNAEGQLKEAAARELGQNAANFGFIMFARRIGESAAGEVPPTMRLGPDAARKVVGDRARTGDIVLEPIGTLKDGTIIYGAPSTAAPSAATSAALTKISALRPVRPAGLPESRMMASHPISTSAIASMASHADTHSSGRDIVVRGDDLGGNPAVTYQIQGLNLPDRNGVASEPISASSDAAAKMIDRYRNGRPFVDRTAETRPVEVHTGELQSAAKNQTVSTPGVFGCSVLFVESADKNVMGHLAPKPGQMVFSVGPDEASMDRTIDEMKRKLGPGATDVRITYVRTGIPDEGDLGADDKRFVEKLRESKLGTVNTIRLPTGAALTPTTVAYDPERPDTLSVIGKVESTGTFGVFTIATNRLGK